MRPGYVLPAVCAFLFGVSSLFEGGNNGQIGALTDSLSSQASENAGGQPQPAETASPKAAKLSAWAYDPAMADDESETGDGADDAGFASADITAAQPAFRPEPARPVFATAGAAVAPEQTELRER